MLLPTRIVEKPWGRDALPEPFAAPEGKRIGEIWFEPPAQMSELLVKFIFTSEKLSVQVHPTDDQAGGAGFGWQGKEECWLVVDAAPGAKLGIGFDKDIDAQNMRAAALDGSIEERLKWYPVEPGDFFYIPANTVHAIGGGVTIIEIQQNSDTTYRVYDWDRVGLDGQPRELHLQEAARAIDYESMPIGPVRPRSDDPEAINPRARLTGEGAPFRVDLLHVNEPYVAKNNGCARVFVVLAGTGRLCYGDTDCGPVEGAEERGDTIVRQGETWLIPAGLGGYRLDSSDGELRLLEAEVGT